MSVLKSKLSVVILTHNDEERIVDCLDQIKFVDELIIVDDNSSDRTIELAEKYTKHIYKHSLNHNFSNQRNFALNKVHNDWVLFVDSDEFISEKLKKEIVDAINSDQYSGYYINRKDYIWGQKISYGEGGTTKLIRLANKNFGKWHGKVHEKWEVKGTVGYLRFPLIHVPHQNVKEFLRDIDDYSSIRANELHDSGIKEIPIKIFLYPIGKFIINFFIKKGYKDGVAGFIYAVMMSFHSFLVRAKLFQLNSKKS